MNDIRFDDRGAGRSGASCRSCKCGGGGGRSAARKKRDEMIVLASSVVVCFGAMGVAIGGGKPKGGDGGASLAAVSVAARDGGGGGGGAAEARERMEADGSKMVKASLLFSEKVKLPGSDTSVGTLAVAFDIEKGWHTYWRNAGDSGLPPTFEFTVEPAGAVEIGEAQWPVPQRHLGEGDILDYIYEGRVLHLFELKRGTAPVGKGEATITCKVSWLVCKEACLPGEGEAKTTIRFTNRVQPTEAATDGELKDWIGRLPATTGGEVRVQWADGELIVTNGRGLGGGIAFFPFAEEGDLIPNNLVSIGESKTGTMRLRFDEKEATPGKRVRGVVRVGDSASRNAYLLETTVP